MRTDGVDIAPEAINAARRVIETDYGREYVPASPRQYQSKAKNAQEAHEAIRPTDLACRPSEIKKLLEPDQAKLYELIWLRTIASQMESAELERTTVDITAKAGGRNLGAARHRHGGEVRRLPHALHRGPGRQDGRRGCQPAARRWRRATR